MKAKHGNQICKKELNRTILVYVLHVVLSQTSGISTTSKLLRLLSGIRKMMFHNAFFFSPLSPSFQEMRYPNLAIFERRICSESAPPIWSSSRCWSKEASPAVENRVPLVAWRFGNRRQPKPGPKGNHFKRIRSYQHLQISTVIYQ